MLLWNINSVVASRLLFVVSTVKSNAGLMLQGGDTYDSV